mgnify:CR=1 FL=1
MAKAKTKYVCQECGYQTPKWMGRCPDCGAWNTLVEEVVAQPQEKKAGGARIFRPLPAAAHDRSCSRKSTRRALRASTLGSASSIVCLAVGWCRVSWCSFQAIQGSASRR